MRVAALTLALLVAPPLATTPSGVVPSTGSAAPTHGAAAPPQAGPAEFKPGEVLVKFKEGIQKARKDQARNDLAGRTHRRFRHGAEHWILGPGHSTEEAIERLSRNPNVLYAEPNYVVHAERAPDDPVYPDLWGLHNTGQKGGTAGADIRAESAWDVSTGSPGVVVGVIDSGIDYRHPDLAPNIWRNPGEIEGNGIDDDRNGFVDDVRGWDFVNDDNDPLDDAGHGTHVAGTIGAVGNNGLGVAGVAWSVTLVPIKFLDAGGLGNDADAAAAIEYATAIGAVITNNSWGGGGFSQVLLDAIEEAGAAGSLFVAAAGNDGQDGDFVPHFPSGYEAPNIVSVAATDSSDHLATFSNYGVNSVDLAAPGVDITSTFPGGSYRALSGTSMATPHVAGVAALLRSVKPGIAMAALKDTLLAGVDRIPSLAGRVVSGGRLNAFVSVASAESVPPGAVFDLAVTARNSFTLTLGWTATGDDGALGTASSYDFRYATSPIDAGSFDAAPRAPGGLAPGAAGSAEHFEVRGLLATTTYYFALKAIDEWGNTGPMSNLASGTTLGPPVASVQPASVEAELMVGGVATRTVAIRNDGPGDLTFDIAVRKPGTATVARRAGLDLPGRPPHFARVDGAPGHAASVGTPGSLRLLLYECNAEPFEIKRLLEAFSDFGTIDVRSGYQPVPQLATLLDYDAVLLVVNQVCGDPYALGDVLADYADAGGGVVLALFSFISPWMVHGRFERDGYHPLLLEGPGSSSSSLGLFDATHPIMAGVTAATGKELRNMAPAPGAATIASWASGEPLVAVKGPNVVGVNVYVGGTGRWTGDIPRLLRNAIAWSAGTRVAWLTVEPSRGIVPAGGQADITLRLDAAGLSAGTHDAELAIRTDDPDQEEIQVPVRLRAIGAPDIEVSGQEVSLESSRDYGAGRAYTTHSLAAPVPPGGPGVIDLVAIGDHDGLAEYASFYVEGIFLEPVNNTGAACVPAEVRLPIEQGELASLLADGRLDVQVLNGPEAEASCPVNRHTIRLRYTGSGATLDFGTVFAGGSRTLRFALSNAGTDPLEVNGLSSDDPAFSPGAGALTLLAGERRDIDVMFSPGGGGTHEGTLTITSNDPDEPVRNLGLRGQAIAAPDIEVTPEHLEALVPSGSIVTRTLTIDNHGAGPLAFEVTRESDRGGAAASDSVLLVEDEAPTGLTYANEFLLASNGLSYDSIRSSRIGDTDLSAYRVVILAGGQPSAYYAALAEHQAQIDAYVASGGVLEYHAWSQAWISVPSPFLLPGGGTTHWLESHDNTLLAPGHPLAAGLTGPTFTAGSSGYIDGLRRTAVRVAEAGPGQTTLAVAPFGRGFVVVGTMPLEEQFYYFIGPWFLLETMIPYAHELPVAAVSIEPASGEIPPFSRREITVTLDASAVPAGERDYHLLVRSDDPDEPAVTVPFHVHIPGVPDLSVSPTSFDFGTMFVGAIATRMLRIDNQGTDDLEVTLDADSPLYSVEPASLSIFPGQSRTVTIQFVAGADGVHQATLRLLSNDPDDAELSVGLTATVLRPPVLAVAPAALDVILPEGRRTTVALSIANPGHFALIFQVTPGAFWLKPFPFAGNLPPGESIVVTVTLDAPFAPGSYESSLQIQSNDPARPLLAIPARLTVERDTDRDGISDVADNCPMFPNGGQEDADADRRGDACDSCVAVPNPLQEDSDHDMKGDACDNCPANANVNQADLDGDGRGDLCDNCPDAANPGQEDANADLAGDACQPRFVVGALEHDGATLRWPARVEEPQGEPVTGSVRLKGARDAAIRLADILVSNDCADGYYVDPVSRAGFGYSSGDGLSYPSYLLDLDTALGCGDLRPDFLFAPGACAGNTNLFDVALALDGLPLPATICVQSSLSGGSAFELAILHYDASGIDLRLSQPNAVFVDLPFAARLPPGVELIGLVEGTPYEIELSATDGKTPPVVARAEFVHAGESELRFNARPAAAVTGAGIVECQSPAGASVTLDGSASTDPDAPAGMPGSLAYEWLRNPGTPSETLLGGGVVLGLTLPLGANPLALRVTDDDGESDTATFTVTVRDTVAPALALQAVPGVLWPPNHGLRTVHVTWTMSDVCDPAPTPALVSATSSEPDDAAGTGDGSTTGDISDGGLGAPDSDLLLRAERAASGSGRFYELAYRATDASGNTAVAITRVDVPRDSGVPHEPVVVQVDHVSADGKLRLAWTGFTGASAYDVIAGDLAALRVRDGVLDLGSVSVLARGTDRTTFQETGAALAPAPGRAFFYLVQPRTTEGGLGYGTESAPWPRVPSVCSGGCP